MSRASTRLARCGVGLDDVVSGYSCADESVKAQTAQFWPLVKH
jgi:hypothetical protein